jgi:hypothetical protein
MSWKPVLVPTSSGLDNDSSDEEVANDNDSVIMMVDGSALEETGSGEERVDLDHASSARSVRGGSNAPPLPANIFNAPNVSNAPSSSGNVLNATPPSGDVSNVLPLPRNVSSAPPLAGNAVDAHLLPGSEFDAPPSSVGKSNAPPSSGSETDAHPSSAANKSNAPPSSGSEIDAHPSSAANKSNAPPSSGSETDAHPSSSANKSNAPPSSGSETDAHPSSSANKSNAPPSSGSEIDAPPSSANKSNAPPSSVGKSNAPPSSGSEIDALPSSKSNASQLSGSTSINVNASDADEDHTDETTPLFHGWPKDRSSRKDHKHDRFTCGDWCCFIFIEVFLHVSLYILLGFLFLNYVHEAEPHFQPLPLHNITALIRHDSRLKRFPPTNMNCSVFQSCLLGKECWLCLISQSGTYVVQRDVNSPADASIDFFFNESVAATGNTTTTTELRGVHKLSGSGNARISILSLDGDETKSLTFTPFSLSTIICNIDFILEFENRFEIETVSAWDLLKELNDGVVFESVYLGVSLFVVVISVWFKCYKKCSMNGRHRECNFCPVPLKRLWMCFLGCFCCQARCQYECVRKCKEFWNE